MRRIVSGVVVLLAAAVLLISYLAGWWSDPTADTAAPMVTATRPATEVTLPSGSDPADATSAFPPSTVTLAVGQQLGVRRTGGAMEKTWYLSSPGDGAVLRPGPDLVVTPCSTNPPEPGCAPEIDQIFVAQVPGTTTLTWTFGNEWNCRPDAPNRAEWRCDVTKSIRVTVR